MDAPMKQIGYVGLFLFGVAILLMLFGIGSMVSPFYLTGGVIGFLKGDTNVNGTGDFTYIISAGFSILLGIVCCALSLVTGGLALGTLVGAAAGSAANREEDSGR